MYHWHMPERPSRTNSAQKAAQELFLDLQELIRLPWSDGCLLDFVYTGGPFLLGGGVIQKPNHSL